MASSTMAIQNENGVVSMTKKSPSIGPRERAVRLTIEVPDSAFEDPPVLDAQLDVPAANLSYPQTSQPIAVEIWSTEP